MRYHRTVSTTSRSKHSRVGLAAVVLLALLGVIHGETLAQDAERGTRTIYLVRHGAYDHEDDRDPDVGKALTSLGIAQARLVAARLRALPVDITSITSSTMTRARETAFVIAEDFPKLEVRQTRVLRECLPPTWRKDIMEEYEDEDMGACVRQLEQAFSEFFVPPESGDRHDVLVCHGNVTRYLVTKALQVDTLSWLQMSVGNCSVTVIRVNPDGSFKVLAVGDMGHLPPNMQSGLDRKDRSLVVPEQ